MNLSASRLTVEDIIAQSDVPGVLVSPSHQETDVTAQSEGKNETNPSYNKWYQITSKTDAYSIYICLLI